MPALIIKIWGNLTEENYDKIKKNQSWLDIEARVCVNCYLDYT